MIFTGELQPRDVQGLIRVELNFALVAKFL